MTTVMRYATTKKHFYEELVVRKPNISGLPEIILIVKRTLKKELYRLNHPPPLGGRDVLENLQ